MQTHSNTAKAWWCILLAGFLWGVGALVAQSAMQAGVKPHSLSLARFALGLPLLWLWHVRQSGDQGRHARWSLLPWKSRLQIVVTGLAMAANVTCWFLGIAVIGATLPTVISICFAPVLVAIFSVARGYESMSTRLFLGPFLGVAGVALIVVTDGFVLRHDYRVGWSGRSVLRLCTRWSYLAWLWNQQLTLQQYAGALSLAMAMYVLSGDARRG